MEILQKQLASVPSTFNSAGKNDMFADSQSRIFGALTEAQARLQMLARPEAPVVRYGETSNPVVTMDSRRVLVAGGAVGAACGFVLAYLLEVIRQWLMRRRRRAAASAPVRAQPSLTPGGLPS
jgi:hypothetical protein